jgi:hypothetical protein
MGSVMCVLICTEAPLVWFAVYRLTSSCRVHHKVDRVPGFLSGRPNWLPSPPHQQASVAPPLLVSWGDTLARGKGGGGANSDEGTNTLVL